MAEYDWNSRTGLAADANSKAGNISKLWIQHLGACAACLCVFSVGNSLGWSSPAGSQLLKGAQNFNVNEKENSLIGSLLTIGAAVSCLPAGYITDKVGRKLTLLGLVPISVLGWGLIMWASSVEMLYVGRFLLGICTGTACVTAPVYAAEICQKEIRGAVGSYFQLFLAGGVLFVFVIGSQLKFFWFTLVCGLVPIIFGMIFIFFPETPIFYLSKGRREEARKSLQFFRGVNRDIEPELYELSEYSDPEIYREESVWEAFKSKAATKSLLMSIGMFMFQQLSGINAIIFNATDIFEHAGSSLDAAYETIIIGLMQVIGTLFATFLVDSLGRVVLLGTSALFMAVCAFFLGIYFYFQENDFEISDFSFLPLISICAFIIMFSIGYGAVPWLLMSELIPSRIKGIGSSMACVTNWLSAFIVTKFFSDLTNTLGRGVTFWIFTAISALAAVFSYKVLPETKGKSFNEIQRQLLGDTSEVTAID